MHFGLVTWPRSPSSSRKKWSGAFPAELPGEGLPGQEEVFGLFGRLRELTNGTFQVEPADMLANDAGGVYLDRLTAERSGRKLEVRLALHVTIRGGQIVEGVDYFSQEHLWDAFWS